MDPAGTEVGCVHTAPHRPSMKSASSAAEMRKDMQEKPPVEGCSVCL